MGRVTVKIKLTNRFAPQLIVMEVEALVDTGATFLCLKPSVIAQLGLQQFDTVPVTTANGSCNVGKYGPVWMEVMGRHTFGNALELDESSPNLIGQIPLEDFDFVVDCTGQRLIGNPAHGGVQMHEIY